MTVIGSSQTDRGISIELRSDESDLEGESRTGASARYSSDARSRPWGGHSLKCKYGKGFEVTCTSDTSHSGMPIA
jgi:hypothetical protein